MSFQQLGLIGCGLMGGSFALAVKRAGLVQKVLGFSPSPGSVQKALDMGVIDQAAKSAAQAVQGSDLVLLALPVAATQATMALIRPALDSTTLVMDVGSSKTDVVAAAQVGLQDRMGQFVPAHPIAGKEVSGVQFADAQLYAQQQVILTPIEATTALFLQRAQDLWLGLGCQVKLMSPQDHDAAFAAVSHLPHLLAFAFMNSLSAQVKGPDFLALAGPGFRDFTRIAASDPHMWRDILIANAQEVRAQSKYFQQQLQALELALNQALSTGESEGLMKLIEQASSQRAGWTMGSTAS
ncbi:MAG: prephenate dehydrogenase/arogenate dehydrogenase family protein [Betaproteobacteria bacterium]|nr:prephenate dehydrogenase/arogenate dehydrogenase family protein [Betaproteobacteria bacterium]NBY71675.1 prephenate dehydrogenase/arogenate dehydrogenase family protein [Betaproteobacteria bacterium]NDD11614.1 prephenate dehydrogenase/arogenate dehydrogenase family protein [Betaproteobacteria bacterium]